MAKIATNADVLRALGLDKYGAIKKAVITLEHGKAPTATIECFIEKQGFESEADWLGIINSGISHAYLMKLIKYP